MNETVYILVDYNEEVVGIFLNIDTARERIAEEVEEGSEVADWTLYEAREIPFRVQVVVEQISRANVDTDLHGSKS